MRQVSPNVTQRGVAVLKLTAGRDTVYLSNPDNTSEAWQWVGKGYQFSQPVDQMVLQLMVIQEDQNKVSLSGMAYFDNLCVSVTSTGTGIHLCTCTHTHAQARAHTHTHTHTHRHTHMHAHTHTHTHTHTNTLRFTFRASHWCQCWWRRTATSVAAPLGLCDMLLSVSKVRVNGLCTAGPANPYFL